MGNRSTPNTSDIPYHPLALAIKPVSSGDIPHGTGLPVYHPMEILAEALVPTAAGAGA